MPRAELNVKLLDVTQDAVSIIYAACRQCYSAKFVVDILKEQKGNLEKQIVFVKKVVESGHESPLEHVKFTFAIEGVSRALTHQLVRHRMASYSQQSQRYVIEKDFNYIIPASIERDETLKSEFIGVMGEIQQSYHRILRKLEENGIVGEKANQDVRFILPQAVETKIVVTMNCRELLHFFKQRCCVRAQWEIRNLANKMLEMCRSHLPAVFSHAGAKCESLGYCPEGEKFTCGKYPRKEEAIKRKKLQ
ncbi:FAD-dependent thymidylate synthase [bacterium]|nr:FAD-dependent thymidylate synthase [bacterium]